ncbi:class I SAM-dependent methyltransferase [Pseudomonas aeruginosa]
MTATDQIMALLERWDRQQEGYIRQREERYEAMFQLLEDLFGRDGRFTAIDAACGPGSLGRRLLERFPAARVVALDADVMLLEIARTALAGFAERVRVVECDLTDPGWTERVAEARESLAGERPAALLSSTALHWLSPAELAGGEQLAGLGVEPGEFGGLLAPGGVLLNADHMRYDRRWPGLAELSRKHRERVLQASVASGADSWEDWWQRAAQIPRLAPLKAQRDAHFARRPLRRASEDEDCSLDFHLAALRQAGFAEAATVWQQLDNYVVFARLAQA